MSLIRKMLKTVSGGDSVQLSEQLLYDKVIGVRSVVPGTGGTTVVYNLAKALVERTNYNVCVVDVNFIYPLLGSLLEVKKDGFDLLDFTESNPGVVQQTRYMNMYYVGLNNRTVIDMMSTRDTKELIQNLIENLKELFDIIIIDLSYEPTNISTYAAIKCNRVIQVADTSLGSITHLKKSQNSMVTLGVPQAKAKEVILNKQIRIADIGYLTTLREAGLEVIGEIPLSEEIALIVATGGLVYGAASKDEAVTAFNKVIDGIVDSMLHASPHLKRYDIEGKLEASVVTEAKAKAKAKGVETDIVVEDIVGASTGYEIEGGLDIVLEVEEEEEEV